MSAPFTDGLGAIAHGPCVLSTGPGIGIGLRCVFAYYEGLLLSFEVKAIGQAARDAHDSDLLPAGRGGRGRGGRGGRAGGRRGEPERPRLPYSSVQIRVPDSAAGTTPEGQPWRHLETHKNSRSHTGRLAATSPGAPLMEGVPAFVHVFVHDIDLWWPDLPTDAQLSIEAGWPELGAPMTTTVLTLANLDRLEEHVVRF